jgi:hypothetical protein
MCASAASGRDLAADVRGGRFREDCCDPAERLPDPDALPVCEVPDVLVFCRPLLSSIRRKQSHSASKAFETLDIGVRSIQYRLNEHGAAARQGVGS